MRELETSLQQCGEFLLKAQLVQENAAPYRVRWVRRFLTRPAFDEPLADQVRRSCEIWNAAVDADLRSRRSRR
jgi:hypothetical protein